VLGSFGEENTTFGDADFGWFGILIGSAGQLGSTLGLVVICLLGLALLGGAVVFQRRVVETGWDPSPHRESISEGEEAEKAELVPAARFAKIPPPEGAPAPPPPPES
jgi:PTS system ascorbate-specific IIC component